MRRISQLGTRTLPATVVSVLALAAAGCGGSSSHTTSTAKSTAPAKSNTPAASTTATNTGLPGKWSGQYSGAYSGTFSLHWTQSGSNLSGKITLSSPPETTGITGSVSGGSIKFGTVSGAVYNGTVSGSSMSGSYTTPNGGGSWNATKG